MKSYKLLLLELNPGPHLGINPTSIDPLMLEPELSIVVSLLYLLPAFW